jgi:SAM-dependent methyltransferase
MKSWAEFWNADTPIYVSERHKRAHYALVAADLADCVSSPTDVVLDFGCGEALAAHVVAQKCGALYLCDAAPLVRDRLAQNFRDLPKVCVCAPEDVEALDDGIFDLIVANSVVQYLSSAELSATFNLWRRKLSPTGKLVVADVAPRGGGAMDEALALLEFGLKHGFFLSACLGLVRTAFSRYPALRRQLGLARFDEAEMIALLRDAGFHAQRRARNFGHNQRRTTFVAEPSAP